MSRKNHQTIEGRLLQTDKKYSHLKLKQKEKIYGWIFEETKKFHDSNGRCPIKKNEDIIVVDAVYSRIEKAEIWIPYQEVFKHYQSIKTKLCKRVNSENSSESKAHNRHPNQQVNFMNMCMVSDGNGNIVTLEKVKDDYHGTTFPGGHVEKNETFAESVIREVKEETGLIIENPKFCGIYHWFWDNVHHMVYIYLAEKYKGELQASEEGQVYWISEKDFLNKKLAPGVEMVVRLIHDNRISECYLWNENGCWKKRVL